MARRRPKTLDEQLAQLRDQIDRRDAAAVELWDGQAYWQMRAAAAERRLRELGQPVPGEADQP